MKKEQFFDRSVEHYFFDDPEAIASYCKENLPEDCEHILRVADEVCEHYFLFDLKWDMERTYEPAIFGDKIDWNYMPAGDPEFIWQFNRHRYFICLGQAYQLTKDEKYAKAYVDLTKDWIISVPKEEPFLAGPWRTLETGLRGEFWNKALRYFMGSPEITEDFLDMFYNSMIEHAHHIMDNHTPYKYMSNWGVLENHGLFEIGCMLPQSEETKGFIEAAIKNLEIEAKLQIMNDGVQWEQSPMYHNEVLHCFLDVILLAKRNNIALPQTIISQVKKMCYANIAWKKPDHHQLMMGDSDNTDIRDVISVGAYLYNDPVMKFAGYDQMDYESIWDLGMKASKEYELLDKKEPSFTSVALEDSGNYYLRSDWSERANFLHMHCGTIGAGHGHSDKLHIDLVVNGEDVLMDSGRYNYVPGPDRYEFKDPTGHNTLTVDGKFFTICEDAWSCSKLSQPVNQKFVVKEDYAFIQGGHLGYMDMESGVFVNRKIIHINPNIYVLVDELYTGGEHSYQQYFHFNNHGKVTKEGNRVSYRGENASADFYFMNDGIDVQLKNTRLSRDYNMAEENVCCTTDFKANGFCSLITVIHTNPAEVIQKISIEKITVKSNHRGTYYPSSSVEALEMTVGDKTYTVIVCHEEVNSPTDLTIAKDCMGFGNVIVFDKDKGDLVGEVLLW